MGEKKETKVVENQLEPLSKLFAPGTMLRKVLPELLIDHTTEKNIVWATDTYQEYGSYYSAERQMFPDFNTQILGQNRLICFVAFTLNLLSKMATKPTTAALFQMAPKISVPRRKLWSGKVSSPFSDE